ncbi:MAG: hypothetical protein ACM3N5_08950 [Candidatus Eiseniibacteriota bacterium]
MIKRLTSSLAIAVAIVMVAPSGIAADPFATAIEGPYLLIQNDNYQRVLSFDSGGAVAQVSDQQALIGFTGGQGAWTQIGADHVTARVIDFSEARDGGKAAGPSLTVYDLKFSGLSGGKYGKVTGSLSGKVYTKGQDPLHPTAPPIRTYSIGFKGERITAK